MASSNLILDTCALLWLAKGHNSITAITRKLINDAPIVFVSSISAWEISIKNKAGKLLLPCTASQWFDTIITHHNLKVLDITSDIAIFASELPNIHRDPCDRFIISTAIQQNLTVLTSDSIFPSYSKLSDLKLIMI